MLSIFLGVAGIEVFCFICVSLARFRRVMMPTPLPDHETTSSCLHLVNLDSTYKEVAGKHKAAERSICTRGQSW
jgi:hypothetical protein